MRNYKELFNDTKKTEETVKTLLNKIPGFKKFMAGNSQLASLFGQPVAGSGSAAAVNLAGLQTRASVQGLIQNQLAAGGTGAMQQVQQNIQAAQSQLNQLKEKLLKATSGNRVSEMPDFKPNDQKTKTLRQRMEYGFNMQFAKSGSLMPTSTDIGLSMGYKLNDESTAGIGAAYKLGTGNIQKIRFTHQGISLRSFIDWKLKKQFFMSGGYELNHFAQFKSLSQLKNNAAWQKAALIGITKKIKVKTTWFKETNVQLLYDFLSNQHLPVSQAVLFRVGYIF